MTIFYIPNPTQYLNLIISTLLTINKQQIRGGGGGINSIYSA